MSGCLDPFDPREAKTVSRAAEIVGKPTRTVYRWCEEHGIGRQIGPRIWAVSIPALKMFASGDHKTFRAYQAGDRESEAVARYFLESGMADVLQSIRAMKARRAQQVSPPSPLSPP